MARLQNQEAGTSAYKGRYLLSRKKAQAESTPILKSNYFLNPIIETGQPRWCGTCGCTIMLGSYEKMREIKIRTTIAVDRSAVPAMKATFRNGVSVICSKGNRSSDKAIAC